MKETAQSKHKPVYLTILLFASCWVLSAVWNYLSGAFLPPGVISSVVDTVAVKAVIWVLPVMLALNEKNRFGNMFKERFPILACIVFLCLTVAFLYTLRLINGLGNTYVFFDPIFILFSVSAGVIEELAFRGGYFHLLEEQIGFWPAALINGAMFTLMHYPGLIIGNFSGLISLRTLLIFTMGIVFCFMYHKWKNLALNITVHTVWDILSYLFCLAG